MHASTDPAARTPGDVAVAAPNQPPTASRYRWWIVVLLFFATTINYVDRQLFANLIPYFEDELRIGPMDLAYIHIAFLLTYGLGMTMVGRFVDRVGVRVGLAVTFLVWTFASVGHALVGSVLGFILIRIVLGVGEAGNFPAAIKAVAEWFPKKERALATGWFNCGSNVGAVATPLLVPVIAVAFGWRACFAMLSGLGIVWLLFWWRTYRDTGLHPKVSAEEQAWIHQDPPDAVQKVGLLALLGHRQVYAAAMARFFSEAPWWFYLTWGPKLLSDRYGLDTYRLGLAIAFIYLVADLGSVAGGWLSSRLIRRGYTVNKARKLAMLASAIGTLPMISVAYLDAGTSVLGIPAVWVVVGIISLAAASHQSWSGNVYTIVSDTLPRAAVATTVGICTAFGSVGSSIFQVMVALWLIRTGGYGLPLVLAGMLYFVALLALHLILPRLQPADIAEGDRTRLKPWHLAAGVLVLVGGLAGLQALLVANQHPYRSLEDYVQKRQGELHAAGHAMGPTAKVGWQDARWVRWTLPDGVSKLELVKLDRDGRPTLEGKGAAHKKYDGPSAEQIQAATPSP